MEKRSAGSMPSARSLRPNSLISLVQGLGIKVPTDCASGKYEKEPASLSVSADLANPSANSRLPLGSPKSFHSPRLKSSRSISPINPRSPTAAKAIGVSPSFRPTTAQKPAGSLPKHSSEGKTNVSASAVKNYPPALPAKKPQSTPKTASSPKAALSTSASQPIKPVSPPVLKKKDSDAPAPAPSLSPQAQRELEASKNMVSPRIEFDAARAASAAQRPEPQAPKRKVVSRGKEIKNKVLQSLVTKVGDTAEPGDQGKSKAEIIYRKHLYQTFRGLKMARSLPLADPVQIQAKRVVLMKPPGKYRRKTAIFDLDETLVHCLDRTEPSVPDVVLPIRFPNGEIVHVSPLLRRI